VIDWLLEANEPSMRYLALTQLMGRGNRDEEVMEAKASIGRVGWAASLLSRQDRRGWWASPESLYRPKYISTNWMLLVLADLGMTKEDPRIGTACDGWIKSFAKKDGGFGMDGSKSSHLCVVGNTARALVKMGYVDHPSVRSSFKWMVKNANKNGGWSCFGSGRNLDSWEPMSAFAAYPRQKWTKGMNVVVEKGAEFFLQRELHIQGDDYPPWYRFHYPVHYYYDMLVGLDFMTALGFGDDRRLGFALSLLKKKRLSDGRWKLDAIHPDVEGGMAEWYSKHPTKVPTPLALEKVGEPSKMITLRALQVLNRIET
jgi:hypothetical protein